MSCYYPTPVKNIGYTDEGKQILTTSWSGSQLDYDFMRPCGKCIGCQTDHRQDWTVRIAHESKLYDHSAMITLTYNEESLPEGGILQYHDIQTFLKRMRRDRDEEVRYYIAGEHGDKYGRPHWHMILFGIDYLEKARKQGSPGNATFKSSHLDELWGNGNTDIIPLSPASISYAAGYTSKKAGQAGIFRQSRKPPIAKRWVEQNIDYLINRSMTTGTVGVGKRQYPIPRIYLDWFPDELSEVIDKNREYVQPFESFAENKNRARELNHYARLSIRDDHRTARSR